MEKEIGPDFKDDEKSEAGSDFVYKYNFLNITSELNH